MSEGIEKRGVEFKRFIKWDSKCSKGEKHLWRFFEFDKKEREVHKCLLCSRKCAL